MPIELIILIASLLVSWLVFNWAFKVLFGIGPNQLFQHIIHLPETLGKMISGK